MTGRSQAGVRRDALRKGVGVGQVCGSGSQWKDFYSERDAFEPHEMQESHDRTSSWKEL